MNHQNWTPITLNKKPVTPKNPKQYTIINKVKNDDEIKKAKIENESESFKIEKPKLSFCNDLKKCRIKANLTQQDLAKKINKHVTIIQDLENGKLNPDGQILNNLNKALNVQLSKNGLKINKI